jgi:hypothetical protein
MRTGCEAFGGEGQRELLTTGISLSDLLVKVLLRPI